MVVAACLGVVAVSLLVIGVVALQRGGKGLSLMQLHAAPSESEPAFALNNLQDRQADQAASAEATTTVAGHASTQQAAMLPMAAAPTRVQPSTSVATASSPPTFNGRPLRAVRTITMKVTAYSPDHRSCGKWADGVTASGYSVWTNGMKLVAADTRLLPFGTIISVPGYHGDKPVPVLDRGGAIKGRRLDVLYPTHEIAKRWGVRDLQVIVWEYADED